MQTETSLQQIAGGKPVDTKPTEDQTKPKVKKALKISKTSKAFNPDDDEEIPATNSHSNPNTSPGQGYSLMEDLKTTSGVYPIVPTVYTQPVFQQQYVPLMQTSTMPFMMPTAQVIQHPIQNTFDHDQDNYDYMFQQLINSGSVNLNPKVYNQLTPGQDLSMNLPMHTGLQQFVDDFGNLSPDDMEDMYEEMLANEYGTRPEHMFGDGSDHHTYSHLEEDDENDEEPGFNLAAHEDPSQWNLDPEAAKRREEIRKNFFNPDFKDCKCCKGYISNCGNGMCENMGVCHCVVRKQNEDTGDTNEIIPECMNCKCCVGFVHACDCVTKHQKMSCKCLS
jgi:hypothetical protein